MISKFQGIPEDFNVFKGLKNINPDSKNISKFRKIWNDLTGPIGISGYLKIFQGISKAEAF